MRKKVFLSWSGGKDSSLTAERLLKDEHYELAGLFTLISEETQKLKLHQTPLSLVEAQAESLGLPLEIISLPEKASNTIYEQAHGILFQNLKAEGIHRIAFGDLFLEEIKAYRNSMAIATGMEFIYPLWHENTAELAQNFIKRGFRSIVTAIDAGKLPQNFAGRQYDENFLRELPVGIDPCGENGEFHTFVWDGPIFTKTIHYTLGEYYEEDYRPAISMTMGFTEIKGSAQY